MRVFINPHPPLPSSPPVPANLTLIRQPGQRLGLAISVLIGLCLAFIPIVLLIIQSVLAPVGSSSNETIPPWIILPVLIVCIPAHEVLHLIWHPGRGFSAQSIVLIWPEKLRFGVYYDGFLKRSRWLVMRLSPLVGLTLLPTILLLLAYPHFPSFLWQQFIELVILVNGLGAGGDLVASIIILRQVPPQGEIGMWNGRACWRPLYEKL